jgi:hypothetical protein
MLVKGGNVVRTHLHLHSTAAKHQFIHRRHTHKQARSHTHTHTLAHTHLPSVSIGVISAMLSGNRYSTITVARCAVADVCICVCMHAV